ncbi:hypothetical protein ACOME3_009778 [Neoechinorhynchus agilis]
MNPILQIINDRLLQLDDKFVRMQSIRACIRMLSPLIKEIQRKAKRLSDPQVLAVSDYLQSIIKLGVSDSGEIFPYNILILYLNTEADVRYLAISSLDDNPKFNYYIAKAENLSILFFATNDEVPEIREVAISLLGQLSNINPSHVLPSLRKILFELLHELYVGELYFTREQTLRCVGNLISSAPRLMCPYIHPIIQILIRVINEDFNSPVLVAAVHTVSMGEMKQYTDDLFFPTLVKMLGAENSTERKEVWYLKDFISEVMSLKIALWTMTRVIQSSACIGQIGKRYPALFDTLSKLIRTESSKFIHREALRVLGAIGALSPYKFKLYSGEISNRIESFPEKYYNNPQHVICKVATKSIPDLSQDHIVNVHSPGNFSLRICGERLYASHALFEILTVLGNPQLKYVHLSATRALTSILTEMGPDASPYMHVAIIHILDIMESTNEESLESMVTHLTEILHHMKRDAEPCLGQIFNASCEVLQKHISSSNPRVVRLLLDLIECLAHIFTSEFRLYAIRLLPILRQILQYDPVLKNIDNVQCVLQLFSRIGYLFEQHMHVVIPAIAEVAADVKIDIGVRKTAIKSLTKISRSINISGFASGIILPLTRSCAPDPTLQDAALDCVAEVAGHLGPTILIYTKELYKGFGELSTLECILSDAHRGQNGRLVNPLAENDQVRRSVHQYKNNNESSKDVQWQESSSLNSNEELKDLPNNAQSLLAPRELWNSPRTMVKQDIHDWFRSFTGTLLAESKSPSLNACYRFISDTYPDISM